VEAAVEGTGILAAKGPKVRAGEKSRSSVRCGVGLYDVGVPDILLDLSVRCTV